MAMFHKHPAGKRGTANRHTTLIEIHPTVCRRPYLQAAATSPWRPWPAPRCPCWRPLWRDPWGRRGQQQQGEQEGRREVTASSQGRRCSSSARRAATQPPRSPLVGGAASPLPACTVLARAAVHDTCFVSRTWRSGSRVRPSTAAGRLPEFNGMWHLHLFMSQAFS